MLAAPVCGFPQINPVYLPQLQQLLTWPQSVGIVGGRPSASLYICGVQEGSFLYLDPHEAQPAARPGPSGSASQVPVNGHTATLPYSSLATYFCDVVRLLPAAALDPSMASGFLCRGPGARGAEWGREHRVGHRKGTFQAVLMEAPFSKLWSHPLPMRANP